jgi:hypothetical protein
MRLFVLCPISVAVAIALGGCAGSAYPELLNAKQAKKPVFVSDIKAGSPDPNGDIAVTARFFNTSHKVYRSVDIHIESFDAAGERVKRADDQTPVVKLRFTGPLKPRRTPGTSTWPRVWSGNTIACVAIRRVDIAHTDGSILMIEGADLRGVLAARLLKSCTFS